jgi:hypothetical protein
VVRFRNIEQVETIGPSDEAGAALGGVAAVGDEREPIAVFRVDGIVEGWIPKQARRITDGLEDADLVRLGTSEDDGGRAGIVEISLDHVIAVAPAPRPPSPARIGRRHHRVEVEAGPYLVYGIAHLPVGADPRRYVATTGRRWLPLTECTVAAADDEWEVAVLIVNLDHARRRAASSYVAPPFG